MSRATEWGLIAAVLIFAMGAACRTDLSSGGSAGRGAGQPSPNLVIIVVDDLRWDEFGAAGHPYLRTPNIDRLAAEGTTFRNAFHVVPLCSPNRASILTGQYPSRHGIIDNVARNLLSHTLQTFPQALQRIGYETAFIGKWHMGNDPTPRPGFDLWVGLPGQGRTVNPQLYENGQLHEVEGYVTDLLTERALAFIRKPRERPFLLYLSHKALHPDSRQLDDGSVDRARPIGYIPAPRHRGIYDEEIFARRPNVVSSRDGLVGKPALGRALAFRDSDLIMGRFAALIDPGTSEETIRRRAEMLLAVDESLARILAALEETGALDGTMILFTSDNGFFYGEHGLSIERRLPYEEAIHNPLLVRYPPPHTPRLRDRRPGPLDRHRPDQPGDRRRPARPAHPGKIPRAAPGGECTGVAALGLDRVSRTREPDAVAHGHGLSGGPHPTVQVHPLDPTHRNGRAVPSRAGPLRNSEHYRRSPDGRRSARASSRAGTARSGGDGPRG